MRPQGDVRLALRQVWGEGPAQVRVAAQKAQVGMAVARYTASRMVGAGELVVLRSERPAVLALASCAPATGASAVRARATAAAGRADGSDSLSVVHSLDWLQQCAMKGGK